jgi:translocator protein
MIGRIRALLVLAATLGVVAFNWMAATGRVNGVTPAEISARYPTVLTPADYAFSIWSLIYLGLIVFSVYQLLPRNIERFAPVRSLYIFNAALNCAWIFFWHSDQIAICLAIIVALLVVLTVINFKLRQTGSALESLLTKAPFGLYLGWVAVAALVNFAVFLVYANIDLGDGSFVFGAAAILVAAAFAVFFRIKLTNYFIPAAVAWGLTAIAVKQSGKTLIVAAAAVGVIACLIASFSFVLDLKSSNNE